MALNQIFLLTYFLLTNERKEITPRSNRLFTALRNTYCFKKFQQISSVIFE